MAGRWCWTSMRTGWSLSEEYLVTGAEALTSLRRRPGTVRAGRCTGGGPSDAACRGRRRGVRGAGAAGPQPGQGRMRPWQCARSAARESAVGLVPVRGVVLGRTARTRLRMPPRWRWRRDFSGGSGGGSQKLRAWCCARSTDRAHTGVARRPECDPAGNGCFGRQPAARGADQRRGGGPRPDPGRRCAWSRRREGPARPGHGW